ncbi:UNVERIFIED_CONTAM: hypothetical protein FKN15_019287 [Acipenser sinensis]
MAASLCQCYQVQYSSRGGGRKGFLSEFVDSLKQELNKNKEMKENIKKFREEAQRLEDSDALKQARRKYKTIESETVKTSEVLKKKLGELSETVKEGLEEVGRSDLGKKIKEGVEEAAKTAKHSAESVSKSGEKLGKTGAFRAISQDLDGEFARRAVQRAPGGPPGGMGMGMGPGPGPGGPPMVNIPPSLMNNPNIPSELLHGLQAGRIGSTIFVANLDYKVGWKKLKEVFGMAGIVVRADILEDKDGKSRGMGTVTFEMPIEAVQAICMDSSYGGGGMSGMDRFGPSGMGRMSEMDRGMGGGFDREFGRTDMGMSRGYGDSFDRGMGGSLGMDRMGSSLDRLGSGMDRMPGLDRVGMGMDRMDRVSDLDRLGSGLDRLGPSMDRLGSGLDRMSSSADRLGPAGYDRLGPSSLERMGSGMDYMAPLGMDRMSSSLDRMGSSFDRLGATGLDRYPSTGLDRMGSSLDRMGSAGVGAGFDRPVELDRGGFGNAYTGAGVGGPGVGLGANPRKGCQIFVRNLCVARSVRVLSARSYLSSFNRAHVYRICRPPTALPQVQYSSRGGGRKGFLSEFMDSLKQELNKNKEMKENIKKFREEAQRLEDSDALKQARRKYKTIESETVKTSEVLKKKLGELSETVKEGLEEVGRSDLGKKIKEGVEEAAKTAKHSAESVSKSGEKLGKTGAFRAISQLALGKMMEQGPVLIITFQAQLVMVIRGPKGEVVEGDPLALGKMMEQGPVLIITFQAQLVMVIRGPKGEVVEGDPEKVLRMMYVWALCRDQDELNPSAAWRLLDISASSQEQVL